MSEWFYNNELVIQTVIVYALLAASVQVPLRSGTFSLAGIGCYGIGGYGASYLVKDGQNVVLSIAFAVVLCMVIGWLLARVLVRLKDLYLGIATLAFDLMVVVVALNWVDVTGGAVGLYGIPLSVSTTAMIVTLIAVVLLLTLLERGVVGRVLQTAREDEALAHSLAIDTKKYQRFTFVISAGLGGLAGAYHGLSSNAISPNDSGFHLVILALAMVIIGGFASWRGAVIGAVILGWAPILLVGIGEWWPAIYGAGMMAFAVLAPGGLIGLLSVALLRYRSSRVDDTAPVPDAVEREKEVVS
jgi:branched-chain amino acid transport system permease protein